MKMFARFVKFVKDGKLTPVWIVTQIAKTRSGMTMPIWFPMALVVIASVVIAQ